MRPFQPDNEALLTAAVACAQLGQTEVAGWLVQSAKRVYDAVSPRCPKCFESWLSSRPLCAHCGFVDTQPMSRPMILARLIGKVSTNDDWHRCILEALPFSELQMLKKELARGQ